MTKRVSSLLGVNAVAGGQPAHLALANFPKDAPIQVAVKAAQPSMPTLVAEAAAQSDVPVARELGDDDLVDAPVIKKPTPVVASKAPAKVETIDPTVANILRATGAKTAEASTPTVAAANRAVAGPRFVSKPVVQTLPAKKVSDNKAPIRVADATPQRRMAAPTPTPVEAAPAPKKDGTHLVQLGSYNSRSDAQAGWTSLQRKFPQLQGRDVVITKAKVKGKIYFRVAAAGFDVRDARSMCGTVKSSGRGCFAYAASSPPAGAIDNGVRIAAR